MRAADIYGDAVDVKIEPAIITVKVPIVQRRGFRNLSVRVVWRGQPANGYRVSNVSVDPSIVTAIGDPGIIEKIPGYLETLPIKIDGVTGDVLERVALVLPESVSVLGSQAVQVAISVTPIEIEPDRATRSGSPWAGSLPHLRRLRRCRSTSSYPGLCPNWTRCAWKMCKSF